MRTCLTPGPGPLFSRPHHRSCIKEKSSGIENGNGRGHATKDIRKSTRAYISYWSRKVFGPEEPTLKSPWLKNKKVLRFEMLRKCKLCLNAKPVKIESSAHQALHDF